MKKTALLLVVVMIAACISFAACDKTNSTATGTPTVTPTVTPTATTTATPTATTAAATTTPASTATGTANPNAVFEAMTSNDDAAIAFFNTSMSSLDAITDYNFSADMLSNSSSSGFSIDVSVGMSGSVIGLGTDAVKGTTEITTSMMGMTSVENIYYENGYAYYTSDDGNYKMAESEDSFFNQTGVSDVPVLTSADCEASKLVQNDDGTKTAYIKFNIVQAGVLIGDLVSELPETATGYLYVTVSADTSGRLTLFAFTLHQDSTEDGVQLTGDTIVTSTYSFDNVTVTAPEGYETYPEASEEID